MQRRIGLSLGALIVVLGLVLTPAAARPAASHSTEVAVSRNFTLVGHSALFSRGENAALAIYRHFVYIGDRTDGGNLCIPPRGVPKKHGCPHSHPGVLVVDVADPTHPRIIDRIGPPLEGNVGETARELRVWPQQHLLMILNFACGAAFGDCTFTGVAPTIRFYDLTGANAGHPKLISTYHPPVQPHEMFLWLDPNDPAHRALLYYTTFENDQAPLGAPNLFVTDISGARQGKFVNLDHINVVQRYPKKLLHRTEVDVHSISLTPDGKQAYLSVWGGTFLVLDTSQFAEGAPNPHFRVLTPIANRPMWPNAHTHSAVRLPGRPYVLTTDEVYGNYTTPFDVGKQTDGCPWGWVHIINISDPSHPVLAAQYRLPQNHQSYCQTPAGQDPRNTDFTSYATHNPTVLPDLALIDWHSNGLQAVNLSDPLHPTSAGFFQPQPLPAVVTDDAALVRPSSIKQLVLWSYPIIKDGLIYVIDIRNGLYILRYSGPHAGEVAAIRYLEGNSNRGDAMKLG